MIARLVAVAVIAAVWGWSAASAEDYPIDQFERVTQCMSDPSCSVDVEDRIDGSVKDAGDMTYQYPLCIGGCVMVCTADACWCEDDDKCS